MKRGGVTLPEGRSSGEPSWTKREETLYAEADRLRRSLQAEWFRRTQLELLAARMFDRLLHLCATIDDLEAWWELYWQITCDPDTFTRYQARDWLREHAEAAAA